MKLPILPRYGLIVLFTLIQFATSNLVHAQPPAFRPKFDFIDNNINGFYEYIPRNFNSEPQKQYPLLIFMHGAGESGSTADEITLANILTAGLPKIIQDGKFPESFNSDGASYRFLAIIPQIKSGIEVVGTFGRSIVEPSTIEAVINYAKTTYAGRIDETRIYLAGLSMGGGAIWDYIGSSKAAAKKIAAVVIAAGAADLSVEQAKNIAASDLPIIATHNYQDIIVSQSRTVENLRKINTCTPAISPSPKAFYWNSVIPGDHNVWTRTFEEILPSTTPGGNLTDMLGMNVFEWMLQFTRAETLPLTWENVTAFAKGNTVSLEWQVSNEQQVKNYEVEKSNNGADWISIANIKPQAGQGRKTYRFTDELPFDHINYYRVKQIDLDQRFSYSPVKTAAIRLSGLRVNVLPNPFSSSLQLKVNGKNRIALVELFNSSGSRIISEKKSLDGSALNFSLDGLGSLPDGVYFLKLTSENGEILYYQKLLKQ
jgi:predicted esterase